MSWVSLDDQFHRNPKVVNVGLAGAGLYARALSYCGDNLTDGYVPHGWTREVGSAALCKKLAAVGLWLEVAAGNTFTYEIDGADYLVEVPDRGYLIPDYLAFNPTREFVEYRRSELRMKRSEAGKKGAAARWGDGKPDGTTNGKTHGKPIANTKQTHSNAMAPRPYPRTTNPVTATEDVAREPDQPGHGYGDERTDEELEALAAAVLDEVEA